MFKQKRNYLSDKPFFGFNYTMLAKYLPVIYDFSIVS